MKGRRTPRAALGPRPVAILLPLLILAAGRASAQEARYYREGRHLVHEVSGVIPAASPRVRVETDLGSVDVRTGNDAEVRYRIRVRVASADEAEARRLLDDLQVSAGRAGDLLLFRGQAMRPDSGRGLLASFELTVPRATSQIDVATGAGDVAARGIDGRATLTSRGGSITADRIGGPLRAETQGGDIEVGSVAATARLTTAGGSLRLESAGAGVVAQTSGGDVAIGRASGDVRAETGGGNVAIEEAAGDVTAKTSGGNIRLGRAGGAVSAATAGGSIHVGSAGGGVHCETAAGAIDLKAMGGPLRAVTSAGSIRADLADARALGDSDLQTWKGDVTIVLPESLAVTIRALVDNPVGQSIRSDFPLTVSRESESAGRPLEIAEGRVAGGGSLLKIRTLGGNILILKAKKHTP
jgi:hypothetical protein